MERGERIVPAIFERRHSACRLKYDLSSTVDGKFENLPQAAALRGHYINADHDMGEDLKRIDLGKERTWMPFEQTHVRSPKSNPQEADLYRQNKDLD